MINELSLKEWLALPDSTKLNIFNETTQFIGLPTPAAIEKDWWVVRTIELVFQSSIAKHIVFKGGTSLSKAWNLIDRFSEDIDLSLDRKFLDFDLSDSEMTGSQVSKLRKKSFVFFTETFIPELELLFTKNGLDFVSFKAVEVRNPDEDPVAIEIYYRQLTDKSDYIQPRVLIEIGSRSLIKPFTFRPFKSMLAQRFPTERFADIDILIPTVNPERTFLEKLFLLHEEFQRPIDKIKLERRSRHLYDIEKMMNTEFEKIALSDLNLYQTIVEHRRKLNTIRGINYDNHSPDKLNFIPPAEVLNYWKQDYISMQSNMIYKTSLPFEQLIQRLELLKTKINQLIL
jgi:hypothetical protein